MALSHIYDGSALVNKVDLADGVEGWSSSGDYGEPGVGSCVIFDPPTDIVGWRSFVVEESSCSIPRIFTGFTYRRPVLHLDAGGGDDRRWDTDLIDLNVVLQFRRIRRNDASGKRPAETDLQRITWLLASGYLDDLHDDYGSVVATSITNLTDNPIVFGEADYRGRTPLDVLSDIAGISGKRFGVRWDEVGSQMTLFYDLASSTTASSTLRISNDPADENSTTFAPQGEVALVRSPEDVFDGLEYEYKGVAIYRTRAATHAAFKIHRDGHYSTDRVGKLATAEAQAAAWLENHSGEIDALELEIEVPADKVNLVRESDRIEVKLTHLPGYETFQWLRVLHRVVGFIAPERYRLKLELDVTKLSGGGNGGGGGGFPWQTDEVLDYTSSTGSGSSFDLPELNTPGAPLQLIAVVSKHPRDDHTDPAGWTRRESIAYDEGSDRRHTLLDQLVTVAAAPYGGTLTEAGSNDWTASVLAFNGGTGPTGVDGSQHDNHGAGAADPTVTATLSGATTAGMRLVAFVTRAAIPGDPQTFEWPTGWRVLVHVPSVPSVIGASELAIKDCDGTETTVSVVCNGTTVVNTTLMVAEYDIEDPATNPPLPGQEVPPLPPTGTVDGSNPDYTAPFPFSDGTLVVLHDGLDETDHVATYDGETGDFTLDYAPSAGSTIVVRIRGR